EDPAALVADVDAVIADNRFPEYVHDVCAAARKRNIPVVLDADEPRRDSNALFAVVSHVIFSAEGLRATAGTDSLGRALLEMRKHTDAFLAVTDGANDVLWLDNGELRSVPAYQVEVVDTLGAGDTFHGAQVYALRRHRQRAPPRRGRGVPGGQGLEVGPAVPPIPRSFPRKRDQRSELCRTTSPLRRGRAEHAPLRLSRRLTHWRASRLSPHGIETMFCSTEQGERPCAAATFSLRSLSPRRRSARLRRARRATGRAAKWCASSCRSRPAAPTTSWRGCSSARSTRRSTPRSSSRTSRAPAPISAPRWWRAQR